MEALAPELLELVVELAVDEMMRCILATKCCVWSRKKYKKIMKQLHHQREERNERIRRRISTPPRTPDRVNIFDYAVKINDTPRITHI